MEAFRNAVKAGCDYLETDVRLADDGILYLCHGATSRRPNQLLKTEPGLVTLVELFETFPNQNIAIDPKHRRAVAHLANLIVEYEAAGRVCVGSSFDKRAFDTADLVEHLGGQRPRVALVGAAPLSGLLFNAIGLPAKPEARATFIHVPEKLVSARTITAAHRRKLKIIAWVVNDKPRAAELIKLGADGFMTDYPTDFKEFL